MNKHDKAPPPTNQEDEYLMRLSTGERVKVSDLTEAEAKDVLRMIIREKRLVSEMMASFFGGIGLHGLFGDDQIPDDDDSVMASFVPGPDTKQ